MTGFVVDLKWLKAIIERQVLDAEIPDVEDLWYPEERTEVADWLGEHGWDASAIGMADLLARYGRIVPADDVLPPVVFVSARRP